MKKLPKIYQNELNLKHRNNKSVFDSLKDYNKEITNLEVDNNSFTDSLKNLSVKEKIKALIDQNRYIFNTKVILIFSDHEKTCQIAGVLNNHIITMDNEIIKIDDLKNIKILK